MALQDVNGILDQSSVVLTIVLCDLVTSRLVLVEVVLSVKPTDRLDLTVQCEGGAEGRKEGGSLEFLRLMSPGPSRLSSYPIRTGWLPGKARSNKATLELGVSLVEVAAPAQYVS